MNKQRGAAPGEDPDMTYVMSRAADRSAWLKISAAMDKYKPLIWLAGFIALAAGFGFKTPSETFNTINVRLDSLERKDHRAEEDRRGIERKIDVLIKLRCFELSEQKKLLQAQLAGLDCSTTLR